MRVVYAMDTAQIPTEDCGLVLVRKGEHWPADDPAVKAAPGLFSTDARYGLSYSVEPEGYGDPQQPGPRPVEVATAIPGDRRNVRRG